MQGNRGLWRRSQDAGLESQDPVLTMIVPRNGKGRTSELSLARSCDDQERKSVHWYAGTLAHWEPVWQCNIIPVWPVPGQAYIGATLSIDGLDGVGGRCGCGDGRRDVVMFYEL
jgi:hypothetical protein